MASASGCLSARTQAPGPAREITGKIWERKFSFILAQRLLDQQGVKAPDAPTTALLRSNERTCPYCDSSYVARSRRQGLWGLPVVRLLGVHVYRCTECWRRFRAFQRRRMNARAA